MKVNHKKIMMKLAFDMPLVLVYIFEVICIAVLIWSAIMIFFQDELPGILTIAARMFLLLAFVIMSSYYTSRNNLSKSSGVRENKKGGAG